jgi:hypothetical protein
MTSVKIMSSGDVANPRACCVGLLDFSRPAAQHFADPRACCVGLLDFSGPAAQHLRTCCWCEVEGCGCVGLLDFSGPAAQHFCGILYVGDIAKFTCFCLWQPFGLLLKFSEVCLGCNVL